VKLAPVLERLQASEVEMANDLRKVAERHATQQDVFHMGHQLADRCDAIASGLAAFVEAYGKRPEEPDGDDATRGFVERVRRLTSAATGRVESTGLLLLRDLRELYVEASELEIDWTIARQGAMTARDKELAISCLTGIQETERIVRWLKTRIKEASPQILAG
jgi:hypothetical protein